LTSAFAYQRRAWAGEAVAQDLCREQPDSATALQLDTADPASVDALVEKIKADYNQKIDFLVRHLIERTGLDLHVVAPAHTAHSAKGSPEVCRAPAEC
jgi:NAD(P)-dependent dehydrogenase (short-subunit alcohol dehydrogenase family)